MTAQLPAAVLWDMDGTLIDSEPYWMRAEHDLVASFGGTWTEEDGHALIGSGLYQSAHVFQSRGVELSAEEIIRRLSHQVLEQVLESVPWRPGAREFIRLLDDARIPSAIVTMSMRPTAEHIAGLLGIRHIVSGSDVTHEKPHPEPYLRGAELMGAAPGACIAVEDSQPGLASAVAAGTRAIGIPAHVDLPMSASYTLWDTLEGRTLDDLAAVFAGSTEAVAR